MSRLYILYDRRAEYDIDAALVLCTANSLAEAIKDKEEMFPDAIIYSYDISQGITTDERREDNK